jgi:hypothetical protein
VFFRARRDGTIQLELDVVIREVVARACTELRELLDDGQGTDSAPDPNLRRLFPVAYTDDPERERAYERLVRDDLLASRLAALDAVVATIDAETITPEQAQQWMAALNAVRLTLGTKLDVTEDRDPTEIDEDDPRLPQFLVYDLLSVLLGSLIAAITR